VRRKLFSCGGEMDNCFSRKIRRNSYLIDPKWTNFFQEKKEEIAF
jgi:hypothetical protein